MQFHLAFLQAHLVPYPLALLQAHLTNSLQALEATGKVFHTGIQVFSSVIVHPHPSGVGALSIL